MEALDWLFQQFPSYQLIGSKAFKPTLENSRSILEYLDHPEKDLKFVHVAGSNGKGSVSSYLASILTESGLRVGLFTSPHIVHFSERIRVNGKPIPDIEVEAFVNNVRETELPLRLLLGWPCNISVRSNARSVLLKRDWAVDSMQQT
ncbi:hypothetical protein N9Y60_05970 [Crocinitomicaceae bacterium]|nr:hypothetical protein [Crocinitomicaceae bacterium]